MGSIGSDGPPYTLMRRLIKEHDFDWVALTSGLGHLNMNQLKTFFAVARHVCFNVLGQEVLNFIMTRCSTKQLSLRGDVIKIYRN